MTKPLTYILVCSYAAMMMCCGACSHEKNELSHDAAHDHGHEDQHKAHDDHDSHDEHDGHHDHEGHDHGNGEEITLEPEQAQRMGVTTMHAHPADFTHSIRATGTVGASASAAGSVSAPTAGIFTYAPGIYVGSYVNKGQRIGTIKSATVTGGDANAAARATLDAARTELDRLKPLYEKKLVTAERYNAAVAAYNLAKAQYSPAAASGAVTAPISGVITALTATEGQYVETGTTVATLSNGSQLTLTADVPDRYASRIKDIKDARIILNDNTVYTLSELDGHKVTTGATAASSPGYLPVTFTFEPAEGIHPGAIVQVYLLTERQPDVISLPLTAITEQQGNHFVYIRVDDEGYVKSPVTLGATDGQRVQILKGVHPHDDVVVTGVTALRLAETSGAVPEGHSHSH